MQVIIPLVLIALVVAGAFAVRRTYEKDFDEWFSEVKRFAPFYGYTADEIRDFDTVDWWDLYCANLLPEQAIKEKLKIDD